MSPKIVIHWCFVSYLAGIRHACVAYKICCFVFQTNQVVDLIRLLLGYIALQLARKLPFLRDGRLLSKLPKHLHPHRHPQGVGDVSKHPILLPYD